MKPKHLQEIDPDKINWKEKNEQYWVSVLTPEQFRICRSQGTERPFSGQFCESREPGLYACVCCGRHLFDSTNKFDSGTGWPSFTEAVDDKAIRYISDNSHGMTRTEVRCNRCDSHLGHVFDDGPAPTGKRYCINSVSLWHV